MLQTFSQTEGELVRKLGNIWPLSFIIFLNSKKASTTAKGCRQGRITMILCYSLISWHHPAKRGKEATHNIPNLQRAGRAWPWNWPIRRGKGNQEGGIEGDWIGSRAHSWTHQPCTILVVERPGWSGKRNNWLNSRSRWLRFLRAKLSAGRPHQTFTALVSSDWVVNSKFTAVQHSRPRVSQKECVANFLPRPQRRRFSQRAEPLHLRPLLTSLLAAEMWSPCFTTRCPEQLTLVLASLRGPLLLRGVHSLIGLKKMF